MQKIRKKFIYLRRKVYLLEEMVQLRYKEGNYEQEDERL